MLLFLVLLPSRFPLEWAFATNGAAPFAFLGRFGIGSNAVAGEVMLQQRKLVLSCHWWR